MLLINLIHAFQTALRALKIERELSRLDNDALAAKGMTRSDIMKTALEMAE